MPATPEQLLAVRLSGAGRAVLEALWSAAVPETAGEAWCAARVRDIVGRVPYLSRQVRRAFGQLRRAGLVDRVVRKVAGRTVEGWRLLTVPLRQERSKRTPATVQKDRESVAPCELSHNTRTKRDDMVTMAKFARRGDSEAALAERMRKAQAKCSEGEWHKIKVHRRVQVMRAELGIQPGTRLPAGDVIFRWKAVNDLDWPA